MLTCGTASLTFRNRSAQAVFGDFDRAPNSLRILPPSLEAIIYAPDHAIVQKVLEDKLKNASTARRTPITAKAADLALKQCRLSSRVWARLSVSEKTSSSQWLDLLTERERDVVAFNQDQLSEDDKAACHGWDVSQGMDRTPGTSLHDADPNIAASQCILTWTKCFLDFNDDREGRLLTAEEHLILQGWPMKGKGLAQTTKFSQSLMYDLAGNAFSSTVCLSVFASLLFSLDWKDESDDHGIAGEAEVEDAELKGIMTWLAGCK